jgi:hypothetical protein
MKQKKEIIIIVIMALIGIAILSKGAGRTELIAGAGDTVSFTYPYSYTANYKGESSASPGINIGAYSFNFGNPTFICDYQLTDLIRWKPGTASKYDDCWSITSVFNEETELFGIYDDTLSITPYLDITYLPHQFTYRYQEKTDSEGKVTSYRFVDDSYINYVFTIKQASKVLTIEAVAPSEVSLGSLVYVNVRVINRLCGGSGGITIDDNAVILNQWYINKQVSFDYDGCDQSITFTLPADKLGRHDMTISAYMNLPSTMGALESKVKKTLSYEVVKENVVQGTSTPSSTTLFISLSEREENLDENNESAVNSVLPPDQRGPITSNELSPPNNNNLRTIALVLFVGSAAGILIINLGRRKKG